MALFKCEEPGCKRVFDSRQGIAMHKVRTHSENKWASRLSVPAVVEDTVTIRPVRQFAEIPTFVVLDDGEGGVWLAERIR